MRTSFTPPTNFSKVNVNQPASLQQRQGMTIPPDVEERLISAIGEKEAWILEQLKKHPDPFVLTFVNSVYSDGGMFLNVMKGAESVWGSKRITDRCMPELRFLLQYLPRLAKEHASKG